MAFLRVIRRVFSVRYVVMIVGRFSGMVVIVRVTVILKQQTVLRSQELLWVGLVKWSMLMIYIVTQITEMVRDSCRLNLFSLFCRGVRFGFIVVIWFRILFSFVCRFVVIITFNVLFDVMLVFWSREGQGRVVQYFGWGLGFLIFLGLGRVFNFLFGFFFFRVIQCFQIYVVMECWVIVFIFRIVLVA